MSDPVHSRQTPDHAQSEVSRLAQGHLGRASRRHRCVSSSFEGDQYQLHRWTCEYDPTDGERLNFDFRTFDEIQIRLSFWGDGLMWFRACQAKKPRGKSGWAFVFAFHGTWMRIEPAEVVRLFKASSVHLGPAEDKERALLDLWAPVEPKIDEEVHRRS